MSSLSKVVEDKVYSFIELIFPGFKGFKGSKDETPSTLESEPRQGHVKEANHSHDCCIQTSVQDQPTKA